MAPSARATAQTWCAVIPYASPTAPATYSVPLFGSITGVEMTPSGLLPSQPVTPDFAAGAPRFTVQTVAPVPPSIA